MDCGCKARCVKIDYKRQRPKDVKMKLRGGTAELRIETGRWCGLEKDERICKMCDEGKVKDVEHSYCTVQAWQRREGRSRD